MAPQVGALPNDARVVDAAFQAILASDWPRLACLQRAYPHLTVDCPAPPILEQSEVFKGIVGRSAWNLEQTAYVVSAPAENVARWMGFRAAQNDGIEVVWHGTRRLADGSFAAQFTVEEGER